MAIRIDNATSCTGRAQAGTLELLRLIRERYPTAKSAGIYNCRPVRGSSSTQSVHSEGRAVDVDPASTSQGDNIAAWVIKNRQSLQVQRVIWNKRIWDDSKGWRAYTGTNDHTDHLHIEQNWDGATRTDFSGLSSGVMLAGGAWWQWAIVGMIGAGFVYEIIKTKRKKR